VGNINLGHDLPLPLLAKHYDAIVFAYGASKDRKIGLQGEDRPHIYSARAFVGWYNGLPEHRHLNPDLQAGDTAIVVGQGNVALDVARALLTNIDALRSTDMTDYALRSLSQSKIRHVHVVGRRGPMQAAFTIKELRELLQLDDVNFTPVPDELFPSDLKSLDRPKRRIMELLKKGSPHKPDAPKSWSLDFLLGPTALQYSTADQDKLEGLAFSKNKLTDPVSPSSSVTPTSETVTLPTSTLFRSIGYKAVPIPGMVDIGAVFDEQKGILQHDGFGRIIPVGTESQLKLDPRPASLYCAGWVKRGPTGVIASTMTDAFQTAEAIVDDWKRSLTSQLPHRDGWEGVRNDAQTQGLKLDPVHWDSWQRIDQAEKTRGGKEGKPREKFGNVEDMLEASHG
jgi:adrenodoxin-NADP+ reductase